MCTCVQLFCGDQRHPISGARITGGCELLDMDTRNILNIGPLEVQYVLLIFEPSLVPCFVFSDLFLMEVCKAIGASTFFYWILIIPSSEDFWSL